MISWLLGNRPERLSLNTERVISYARIALRISVTPRPRANIASRFEPRSARGWSEHMGSSHWMACCSWWSIARCWDVKREQSDPTCLDRVAASSASRVELRIVVPVREDHIEDQKTICSLGRITSVFKLGNSAHLPWLFGAILTFVKRVMGAP